MAQPAIECCLTSINLCCAAVIQYLEGVWGKGALSLKDT